MTTAEFPSPAPYSLGPSMQSLSNEKTLLQGPLPFTSQASVLRSVAPDDCSRIGALTQNADDYQPSD